MATLTIRNVDDETKQALRFRAARHGVSMEQEVRTILRMRRAREATTLVQTERPRESWYESIRELG